MYVTIQPPLTRKYTRHLTTIPEEDVKSERAQRLAAKKEQAELELKHEEEARLERQVW
jgi:hypothetical protein